MTEQPIGLRCPGCDQPPALVLDAGHQCFCGNTESCRVVMWDSTKTLAELAEDPQWLEWRQ